MGKNLFLCQIFPKRNLLLFASIERSVLVSQRLDELIKWIRDYFSLPEYNNQKARSALKGKEMFYTSIKVFYFSFLFHFGCVAG